MASGQTVIVAGSRSAPRTLGVNSAFFQFFDECIAVFALDLDHPVSHPTSGTTPLFQGLGQRFQLGRRKAKACNDTHALTPATGGLTGHSNRPLLGRGRRKSSSGLAAASIVRKAAASADAACACGIHQTRIGAFHR